MRTLVGDCGRSARRCRHPARHRDRRRLRRRVLARWSWRLWPAIGWRVARSGPSAVELAAAAVPLRA